MTLSVPMTLGVTQKPLNALTLRKVPQASIIRRVKNAPVAEPDNPSVPIITIRHGVKITRNHACELAKKEAIC